ncbi:hypothetical protein EDC01DRAFT_656896 [Geopyxis carbonaria]|nr:hypothetical protein EDC01DRAFT_656896 [Geopyxis carbonaria]
MPARVVKRLCCALSLRVFGLSGSPRLQPHNSRSTARAQHYKQLQTPLRQHPQAHASQTLQSIAYPCSIPSM